MDMIMKELIKKYNVKEVITMREYYNSWIDFINDDDTVKNINYEGWDIVKYVGKPCNNVVVKEVEEGYIVYDSNDESEKTFVLNEED